jgi:Tol biopolymer transport system component
VRLTTAKSLDRTPAWSPDGAYIAFVSNRSGSDQVWLMNADGSNQHQITNAPAGAYEPDWQPLAPPPPPPVSSPAP